jgi:hypothetical protein
MIRRLMVRISAQKYAKEHFKCNTDMNLKDIISRLKDAAKQKNYDATCNNCRASIYAVGSMVDGLDGCFTCIT